MGRHHRRRTAARTGGRVAVETAPPRYQEWLTHVFHQPLDPQSPFPAAEIPPFAASSAEIVALITHTLRHCGRDLATCSEAQTAAGVDFMFNNSASNTVFALKDATVPVAARLAAIAALRVLYSDCFARRCVPLLSHRDEPAGTPLDEPGGTPLDGVCYMLWDVTPLAWWEDRPDKAVYYDAVLDVLAAALMLEHDACRWSALHGLGHLPDSCRLQVERIVRRFLAQRPTPRPELVQYAVAAASGRVL